MGRTHKTRNKRPTTWYIAWLLAGLAYVGVYEPGRLPSSSQNLLNPAPRAPSFAMFYSSLSALWVHVSYSEHLQTIKIIITHCTSRWISMPGLILNLLNTRVREHYGHAFNSDPGCWSTLSTSYLCFRMCIRLWVHLICKVSTLNLPELLWTFGRIFFIVPISKRTC